MNTILRPNQLLWDPVNVVVMLFNCRVNVFHGFYILWIIGSNGEKRLVTGGEDARLCEWDLSGNTKAAAANFGGSGKNHGGGGPMSGRAMKSSSDSKSGKGKKKKFGSPY